MAITTGASSPILQAHNHIPSNVKISAEDNWRHGFNCNFVTVEATLGGAWELKQIS